MVSAAVMNTISSPSRSTHTGATCGEPSARTSASLAGSVGAASTKLAPPAGRRVRVFHACGIHRARLRAVCRASSGYSQRLGVHRRRHQPPPVVPVKGQHPPTGLRPPARCPRAPAPFRPSMAHRCSQPRLSGPSVCRGRSPATVDDASLLASRAQGGMDGPSLFGSSGRGRVRTAPPARPSDGSDLR